MIVVSDTSPLSYLQQIGRLEVLPRLFGDVLIPPAVADEWARDATAPAIQPTWIRVAAPRNESAVEALLHDVDRGEAEAIVLAEEQRAELLLIDENDGRAVAEERGLTITGVLGVLIRSKQQHLIPAVRPEIVRLLSTTSFFCEQRLINRILQWAGEPPLPL